MACCLDALFMLLHGILHEDEYYIDFTSHSDTKCVCGVVRAASVR
jgi:hypothetical protein